jgi:phage protein D
MAGGTLQFRPRPIAERATVKLALGADLVELSPRMTMANLSAEVRVQGWDAVAKQAIVGKAGGGKELGKMSGTTAGTKAAQSAFGKTSLTVVDAPVSSVAEADQMAAGLYNTMALQYVVGDGECHGRPDLEAGMLIEVSGVGEQFGGTYYLTSVEHRWHVAGGYRTFITYQRNST